MNSPPCTPSRPEATPGSKVIRWLWPGVGVTNIVCYDSTVNGVHTSTAQMVSDINRQLSGQIVGAYWIPVVRGESAPGTE